MKIKSINDVITNSSDETYIIKTPLSARVANKLFKTYMEECFPDEWDPYDNTISPSIYDNGDDTITVDWSVICNLDDAYGKLCTVFGAHNIL